MKKKIEGKEDVKLDEQPEGDINTEPETKGESDSVVDSDDKNGQICKTDEEDLLDDPETGLIHVESGSDFEDNLAEKWKNKIEKVIIF